MKYIVATIVTICIVGMIACSNDGGESMVLRKNSDIDCTDFQMYIGTPLSGGEETKPWSSNPNRDSTYRRLVSTHYFRSLYASKLQEANDITFEFVGNDKLMYVVGAKKIVADYFYKEDSLFVLQMDDLGKETPTYVAKRDADGRFYNIISIRRAIVKSLTEPTDSADIVKERVAMDDALKLAKIAKLTDMKDARDTIMWCNVRYNFN